jgi:hypothetical protein
MLARGFVSVLLCFLLFSARGVGLSTLHDGRDVHNGLAAIFKCSGLESGQQIVHVSD